METEETKAAEKGKKKIIKVIIRLDLNLSTFSFLFAAEKPKDDEEMETESSAGGGKGSRDIPRTRGGDKSGEESGGINPKNKRFA